MKEQKTEFLNDYLNKISEKRNSWEVEHLFSKREIYVPIHANKEEWHDYIDIWQADWEQSKKR